MDGKGLSELRQSSAAGPHGKKSADRANTEREAIEAELADAELWPDSAGRSKTPF